MKVIRFFRGLFKAVIAFFRAYDPKVGETEKGLPILDGWSEDQVPYDFFEKGLKVHNFSELKGALVFTRGKEIGEVSYLTEGSYRLGTGCTNDIVVTTSQLNERSLSVEVSSDSVRVKSTHKDAPILINGHRVRESRLVDQDECEFNGATFYYSEFQT